MSERHDDQDGLGPELGRWTRAHDPAPDTPREEIWDGVLRGLEAVDRAEGVIPSLAEERHRRGAGGERGIPWGWLAVAAAAVLALGIGLGRMSAPAAPGGEVAAGPSDRASGFEATSPLRAAATEHLTRTEGFLTLLRGDVRVGRVGVGAAEWAGSLLMETRLLLDSPAAEDPALRSLLEDLELVLVQIAGLEDGAGRDDPRGRRELDMIAEGLDQRDVLTRLQAFTPARTVTVGL